MLDQDPPSSPPTSPHDAAPAVTTADGHEAGRDDILGTDGDELAADDARSSTRTVVEWVLVIAGALVVAIVIKTFLMQAFYIPSSSMEPTLRVGDRVLVNKLSYRMHEVNRGDIVVFERPSNASASDIHDLIKRVVGLPNETIVAHDCKVFVNGDELAEPYLPESTCTGDFEETTIPLGHVFVLGDNRSNSSASNIFGPIDEDLIVGRAFVRVWPVNHLGGL